jgi:tripartite-type tricarboxylate transporter receptor subunit TctC
MRVPERRREKSMELPRRAFLQLAAAVAALPATRRPASAYGYPTRPVRILVGFTPGGAADLGARVMAQWLSQRLGQPFIVENRAGAASNLATEAVVRAPADGYTLLAVTVNNTVNAAVYRNLGFNFIRDITMVAGIMRQPLVLVVNPAVPVTSVAEFIGYIRDHPGEIGLASFGTGTVSHVVGEMFKMRAGVDMVHIPYRGGARMVVDLLAGQIKAAIDSLPSSIEHIRAGRLRALAVTTAMRSPALPNVAAMGEFLLGFEASAWICIGAPSGTAPEIIDKLNGEINAGLANPAVTEALADFGGEAFVSSPADLARFVVEKTEAWAEVVRAANITAE